MKSGSIADYLESSINAIKSIDIDQVESLATQIAFALDSGKTLFICANGGSASTANHMVNDFVIARYANKKQGQVLCLTDNQAIVSALANDFDYSEIFSKQLAVMGREDDLLLLISASGNSANLIKAFDEAKKIGMKTSAILGFNGGKLIGLVDFPVLARTEIGKYGEAEDAALVVNHAITIALRS